MDYWKVDLYRQGLERIVNAGNWPVGQRSPATVSQSLPGSILPLHQKRVVSVYVHLCSQRLAFRVQHFLQPQRIIAGNTV